MQLLTAPPRDNLTDDQVRRLLTGDQITVATGCEVLDGNDQVIDDLADDLVSWQVDHNSNADIHGSLQMSLTRQLDWQVVRVKPYMTLTDPVSGLAARFNQGVYLVTTPLSAPAETPQTWDVTGYDKLYLLQRIIGDTRVAASGAGVLSSATSTIAASGATGAVLIDGTSSSSTLADPYVWVLDDSDRVTWLGAVNDLLAAVAYQGLWVDQDGNFRSNPYATPVQRPVEWLFTMDGATSIVAEDRTLQQDGFGAPNWWRFTIRNPTTQPSEGAGQYTTSNQSDGPYCIDRVGYVRRVEWLDVVSHSALVTQGNRLVQEDRQITQTMTLSVSPLPILGHFDVIQIDDPALGLLKGEVRAWSLPSDGSDATLTVEIVA